MKQLLAGFGDSQKPLKSVGEKNNTHGCVLDQRPGPENLLPPEVSLNSNIVIFQKKKSTLHCLEEEIWKGQGMKPSLQAAQPTVGYGHT